MSPTPTTIPLHLLNLLIGLTSIAILALVSASIKLTTSLSARIPSTIKGTGRSLLFWPGCGGVVDMVLFLYLWILQSRLRSRSVKDARKVKWTWNGIVFVGAFVVLRPLITLIYTFVEYAGANLGADGKGTGYVTTETWACAAGSEVAEAERLCRELKAARWLLVPEVVMGIVLLGLVVVERVKVGRKGEVDDDRKEIVDGKA